MNERGVQWLGPAGRCRYGPLAPHAVRANLAGDDGVVCFLHDSATEGRGPSLRFFSFLCVSYWIYWIFLKLNCAIHAELICLLQNRTRSLRQHCITFNVAAAERLTRRVIKRQRQVWGADMTTAKLRTDSTAVAFPPPL